MNLSALGKTRIAGGTGLVGANLLRRLLGSNIAVSATFFNRRPEFRPDLFMHADLRDLAQCLEVTKGMDTVFGCAAYVTGIEGKRGAQPAMPAALDHDLRIVLNLLAACAANRVTRFVYISTSTVYPQTDWPVREDQLDLNAPPFPAYALVGNTARYLESVCRHYAEQGGLQIAILRPTNLYGPHDRFDAQAHVLPALIRRACAGETPFVVRGNGTEVRDFLYIDDFIDDLLTVASKHCVCDPVNVANGAPTTVREALNAILRLTGRKVTPEFDGKPSAAIPYRMLDTAKFNALFGRPSRISLDDGLLRTIAWHRSADLSQVTSS